MANQAKGAIVGLGVTPMGKIYGRRAVDFAAEAIALALDDAGLQKSDIDGLLINANIPEYLQGNRFNHEPKRPRKLLLNEREIVKMSQAIEREGMTLIPLKLYFNEKGRAKLEVSIARGKKLHDKRETDRKRSWERERGRLMRQKD